jgi:hypothetical protein
LAASSAWSSRAASAATWSARSPPRRALDQAGFKILACGLRAWARDEVAAGRAGYTEEELERLFLQLA